MLLLAGLPASAQMKRGSQKKEAPKTEKTTSKKQSGSSSQSKKKKTESSSRPQLSSSHSNSALDSLSQSTVSRPAELTAYDVTFSCNVSDADMFIDGNDYGHPIGTRTLKIGSHQVVLVAQGYEDYTDTIQVKSGITSFDFKMTRVISTVVQQVINDMVFVEGGTFTMGATKEQGKEYDYNETPDHQVTLSSYYIGKYEVTQELWQAVMRENPSYYNSNPHNPVERVSWYDCQMFICELNKMTGRNFRLPTEAEWEYAARGGNQSCRYKYSGKIKLDMVAWYQDNSGDTTHPVGQKSPNELGLYDMSGNVYEWCQDWYDNHYRSGSQINPEGPSSGAHRIIRGGCVASSTGDCRVSSRSSEDPRGKNSSLGFRLAL